MRDHTRLVLALLVAQREAMVGQHLLQVTYILRLEMRTVRDGVHCEELLL